jgi:hypothetical protein
MSVTVENINIAVSEAERFIVKAKEATDRLEADRYAGFGCKETGALRRSSMDLTRALVGIRSTKG